MHFASVSPNEGFIPLGPDSARTTLLWSIRQASSGSEPSKVRCVGIWEWGVCVAEGPNLSLPLFSLYILMLISY